MKKIRVLKVEFENEVQVYEIPAFRAAVIEQTGRQFDMFHNHADNMSIYRYPLIQYKRIFRHPAIICIDEGVDHLHHFFENKGQIIFLGDKEYELKVGKLNLNQFTMQVWETMFYYTIENWIALNEENYSKYRKIDVLKEQIEFLEKTLTANILAFAKGIEWNVDKEIQVNILSLDESRIIKVKNNRFSAFNATFKTNVFLPNFIGLGKSVSKGFGTVKQKKRDNNEKNISYGR